MYISTERRLHRQDVLHVLCTVGRARRCYTATAAFQLGTVLVPTLASIVQSSSYTVDGGRETPHPTLPPSPGKVLLKVDGPESIRHLPLGLPQGGSAVRVAGTALGHQVLLGFQPHREDLQKRERERQGGHRIY